MLNIGIVYFIKEVLNALVIFVVVHNDEAYLGRCNESGHKPLIKAIYTFQLHIGCLPFVLIYQI